MAPVMDTLSQPNVLGHSAFTSLNAKDLARIPTYAFATLDLQHCQWLTASQTGALSPSQVAALTPTQIAALAHADRLSPSVFKILSPQQAGALCTQWEWLSGEQINALSPSAITALPLEGVARLSKRALPFLAPSTLRAITAEQMSALAHPDWLPDVTVQAMTPEQVRAVRVNWRWMSADWINALTPRAIAAIPTSGIAQWAPATVSGLDAHVLKAKRPPARGPSPRRRLERHGERDVRRPTRSVGPMAGPRARPDRGFALAAGHRVHGAGALAAAGRRRARAPGHPDDRQLHAALFLRHDDPRRPPVAVARRALPHHTALSGASP